MNSPVLTCTPVRKPVAVRRSTIFAASIGNALEWFDIVVYGYFAISIAKAFFPTDSEASSMLIGFGTFGISYLSRPLGALVIGAYADRAGRKKAMLVSISLMMVGTLTIAVMPSYASIGLWAPVGIILARLVQGFSAGGEFGSSTALLVENDPTRRGFMASFQFASQGLMTLTASLFGLVLTTTLTSSQLDSWGWRIPFFFGLLIGPVGLYIRRHIDEGMEFKAAKSTQSPLRELVLNHKKNIAMATGTLIVSTAAGHTISFMPVYAMNQFHLPMSVGFSSTLIAGFVLTFATPFVGHFSDKFGRTKFMVAAAFAYALTVMPAFMLLGKWPSVAMLMGVMFWLALLKALYFGALPALMAEAFPPTTRATGMSLSYNIGTIVFGGFTPFFITGITLYTSSSLAPAMYLIPCALLSLTAIRELRVRLNLR
jgi:MHS family proline/betaine transporter-like MFS transporter